MGWLSVRRAMIRDAAAAAVFAVLWFGGLWIAHRHGRLIDSGQTYPRVGIWTFIVLLTRQLLAELPEIASRMAAVGLPVELRLPPVTPVLPAAVELAAVRIIQEALTNVLVHAKASRAVVVLEVDSAELRLAVDDDGTGGWQRADRDARARGVLWRLPDHRHLTAGRLGSDRDTSCMITA